MIDIQISFLEFFIILHFPKKNTNDICYLELHDIEDKIRIEGFKNIKPFICKMYCCAWNKKNYNYKQFDFIWNERNREVICCIAEKQICISQKIILEKLDYFLQSFIKIIDK